MHLSRTAVTLGAVLVALLPASARAATPSFVTTNDCDEHQAFVDGDDAYVAAHLPRRYSALRDAASGRPLVFVRALRCARLTLDGRAAPVTMASFGIVIDSPDGTGCASSAPAVGPSAGSSVPLCNWYTLSWLADDARVPSWLRTGTAGFPAVHVPGLVFRLGVFDPTRGGEPMHFETPSSAPSPFTMDELGRPRPGELSVRGTYWNDTPQGTVMLRFASADLTSGDATGTVRAAPGSELARLMGATERPYAAGYSSIAAEHWRHSAYRKQVQTPGGFAGDCSVKGTVKFDPPATNSDAALTYDYSASGTCSGTLDGRSVTNVPVTVHHAGAAFGGCQRAVTTAPSQGALVFGDGTRIGYTLDFSFVATEGDVTLYGERSGWASGHASFLTQRTPPDVPARCGSTGVTEVPLDLSFTTKSPLVGQAAVPGRAQMRLSVRPRDVRAGRRRRFALRVTTAGGRPVAGATVRLGHHRARTGRSGRASLVATLKRLGRVRLSATAPGFAPATATVRVHRDRGHARAPRFAG